MSEARNAPYRTLLHTFRGHEQEINRIAWSPDGRYLASSSFDGTVRIWDTQMREHRLSLRGRYLTTVYSVAWSPDGRLLAACMRDGISVGEVQAQLSLPSAGSHSRVYDLIWLPSGSGLPLSHSGSNFLASCSADETMQVWEVKRTRSVAGRSLIVRAKVLIGHSSEVYCISVSKDRILASGSSQGPIRLWRVERAEWEAIGTLRFHERAVYSLAWSPDGQFLASSSEDRTIRIYKMTMSRLGIISSKTDISFLQTLEGHTGAITSVSFSHDGRLLASKGRDGVIGLWRTDTWELVGAIEAPASNGVFAGLAFHPSLPLLATASEKDMVVQVWQLDISAMLGLAPQLTVHYVNAKVVLAGESGVGKTALGRALAGQPFIATDSTHGRFIHTFKTYTAELAEGRQEQREVFLWDLAGQAGSRLIHQLHLPEAAVVLLIFSDMGGDPLTGIRYWGRALRTIQDKQAGNWPVTKFLVEARVDTGGVRLSRDQIDGVLREWGLSDYYRTSAKENSGIDELRGAIENAIQWDLLPKVSSTELFQRIKAFLIERKEAGYVIESFANLYRAFQKYADFMQELSGLRAQFETCIGHLDAQGLLRRLNFGGYVLLLPEKLDEYADALVRTVRAQEDQLGSIAEADVLAGRFALPQDVRLNNQDEEKILLLALVQDLLSYEIALREETDGGSYLVFPSEVMRQPQAMDQQQALSKTIIFTFEGPVLNIYATLAVRLAHSGLFEKRNLWQNCMLFAARAGGICRCDLREPAPGEGRGELTLLFDTQASEETRYYFETYIQAHLQKHVGEEKVQRQRVFLCQNCQTLLSDEQVRRGRELGRTRLACPMGCGMIDIRDHLERLAQPPDAQVQEQMEREADARTKRAVDRSLLQSKAYTQSYDVYISYSSHDEQAARKLRDDLQEHGYFPWLVNWDSIPGLPRQQQVDERIEHMRAAVVLIGQHEMDAQRQLEVESMMRQFSERACPIIPAYLPDAPPKLRVPPFLQNMVEVDFRKQEPDPLERLIMGIQNKRV
jgi:WD40 repeat protein